MNWNKFADVQPEENQQCFLQIGKSFYKVLFSRGTWYGNGMGNDGIASQPFDLWCSREV